ncbi:MAG: hypothetical protein KC458_07490 [Dehalococcoidia bacterium]|nr:hypothetical protein [Dehalococcoidia bacterium]
MASLADYNAGQLLGRWFALTCGCQPPTITQFRTRYDAGCEIIGGELGLVGRSVFVTIRPRLVA